MIADARWVHRVLKSPDQRCRNWALAEIIQPAIFISCPLQQVLSNVKTCAGTIIECLNISVGELLGCAFGPPGLGRPLLG